ncbi:MAG: hypothetical protein R6W75_04410 [Smithellaceae bacterium]
MTSKSTSFPKGIVICSAHLAKDLEFDQVIVPEATSAKYSTDLDRNLLYVICIRAMHRLIVTRAGEKSRFVPA